MRQCRDSLFVHIVNTTTARKNKRVALINLHKNIMGDIYGGSFVGSSLVGSSLVGGLLHSGNLHQRRQQPHLVAFQNKLIAQQLISVGPFIALHL